MPDYSFGEARLRTTRQLPYLTQHVMSLIPVERPGLGTFAVDQHMRVYYDPAVLSEWTLDQCAGVILHEDCHVLFHHAQRCLDYLGPNPRPQELEIWNWACDVSVNQSLRRAKVPLPDDAMYPEQFGLEENLQVEAYYDLLWEQAQKKPKRQPQPDQQQGQGGSNGPEQAGSGEGEGEGQPNTAPGQPYNGQQKPKPGCGSGGSGADGDQKPWECPPPDAQPTKANPPGMNAHEQHMLERVIAHEIEKYEQSKGRGSVPGDFARFAEAILRPKTDPWRELLSAVKYAVTCTNGHGNYTWKKLPRRTPLGGMRLPAHVQPSPRVCVFVDTSGSMGQQDLGLAMGVVDRGLKTVPRENLRVASGDTELHVCKRVFRLDQVELLGGGGTDMGAAIVAASQQKPAPDVIVVLTDGVTPWPDKPVRQRVVACLTQPESGGYTVPEWIKKVVLEVAQ